MPEAPEFLTRRLREYDDLVDKRRAELERARAKRDAFQEVLEEWEKHTSSNGTEAPSDSSDDGPTIRESVTMVLREADHPLTRKEIVAEGADLGLDLNENSVRWDTYHGVDDGVYEKLDPREGSRAKRYRLA